MRLGDEPKTRRLSSALRRVERYREAKTGSPSCLSFSLHLRSGIGVIFWTKRPRTQKKMTYRAMKPYGCYAFGGKSIGRGA